MSRINEILKTKPKVEPGVGRRVTSGGGRIEFREVSFRFPNTERDVLRRVSFSIRAGETVALVGPTGAGKSTLVSLIPRIYDPTGGQILFDGIPLPEYDPERLRQVIGVVPQDTFLFSETIASNIGLGLRSEAESRPTDGLNPQIRQASEVAQLHDQVAGLPRG